MDISKKTIIAGSLLSITSSACASGGYEGLFAIIAFYYGWALIPAGFFLGMFISRRSDNMPTRIPLALFLLSMIIFAVTVLSDQECRQDASCLFIILFLAFPFAVAAFCLVPFFYHAKNDRPITLYFGFLLVSLVFGVISNLFVLSF
jgi:hypothetical protein